MDKLKNIIKGILPVVVFFMATQVGVAQEKNEASNDNVEVKEIMVHTKTLQLLEASETKVAPHFLQGGSFQYNGPNGGGNDDEWKDLDHWSPVTGAIPCPGIGEACMIELPTNQNLLDFLNSKASYEDLLADEEHVEQRAP